jgi:hypothetical protein
MPLLDSNGHCEAVVCGNDGHLTFTIDIPNAPDNVQAPAEAKRCLPESVLPRELIIPFSKEERQLQFVALKLDGLLVKEDNVDELIEMTNVYLPLSRLSLSKDDNLWRDHIYKKVAKALKLSITDEQKRELEHARDTLCDTQGDFHRTHENLLGKVFEQQLSQLSQQAKKEDGLYAKFEEYLTSSKKAQSEVIESLKGWFAEMPRVELRDYHNHDQLAMSINYLKVSRRELYEVYSAILLIERYDNGEQVTGEVTAKKQFAQAVKEETKTEAVITELRRLMEGKTKPKDVIQPIRAAIEAGVIRRPTWEEFNSEFEGRVKSKSSFSDYTNPGDTPYQSAEFDAMIEAFRKL